MKRKPERAVAGAWRRSREILVGIRSNFKFSNGLQLNLRRLFFRRAAEVTYVWDRRIRMACDCARLEHLAVREVFVEGCYARALAPCVFPGNRISVVDVGANVGAFDLWLWSRGLRIEGGIAAELNATTHRRCAQNLQRNGLDAVRAVNCGVAARDGWIEFVPSRDSPGDNIFGANPAPGARLPATRVELISLATLLQRHAANRTNFDLLKLDCEGAEYEILRTSPAVVLQKFRYLIAEFHAEPAGESLAATWARLREIGFAATVEIPLARPCIALFVRGEVERTDDHNLAAQ